MPASPRSQLHGLSVLALDHVAVRRQAGSTLGCAVGHVLGLRPLGAGLHGGVHLAVGLGGVLARLDQLARALVGQLLGAVDQLRRTLRGLAQPVGQPAGPVRGVLQPVREAVCTVRELARAVGSLSGAVGQLARTGVQLAEAVRELSGAVGEQRAAVVQLG